MIRRFIVDIFIIWIEEIRNEAGTVSWMTASWGQHGLCRLCQELQMSSDSAHNLKLRTRISPELQIPVIGTALLNEYMIKIKFKRCEGSAQLQAAAWHSFTFKRAQVYFILHINLLSFFYFLDLHSSLYSVWYLIRGRSHYVFCVSGYENAYNRNNTSVSTTKPKWLSKLIVLSHNLKVSLASLLCLTLNFLAASRRNPSAWDKL